MQRKSHARYRNCNCLLLDTPLTVNEGEGFALQTA